MKTFAASSTLALLAGLGLASAALADGEFAGVTIDAKLIGGQQLRGALRPHPGVGGEKPAPR